jgi:hypothetical protein
VIKVITFLVMLFFAFSATALITLIVVLASYVPRLNKGILTDHTITLSPDGFTELTSVNKTESTWGGLSKLGQNQRYIFLFISEHAAHTIPKRAFPSREIAAEFYNYAKEQVRAHKAV